MRKPKNCDAFEYREFPLERAGVALHLDCLSVPGAGREKNILLTHGVTCSSHVFDVDCGGESLARRLAREGWRVWTLDVAGYGLSGAVRDGFAPNADYAAEDIRAAADLIFHESGQRKIDLLGWSWGTVTAGRFCGKYPESVRELVLYAPILCGVGRAEISEPFHRNSREHAAEDFQKNADGSFDLNAADRETIDRFCDSCRDYDGAFSPNGGRREICVERERELIALERIRSRTLVICGDRDPYLDYEKIRSARERLPEGSELVILEGGSHILMLERPYYRDFQDRVVRFLRED